MQPQHTWGVPTVSAPIEPASYIAICSDGAQLAIKVMSTNDLYHALRTKTLYPAMLHLRNVSPWAYLIITDNSKKQLDDSMQGALLSVQEMGVCTLMSKADDVVETVERLAQRERGARRIRPPRETLFAEPAMDMLLALPGIGEKTAEALLQHCGTAAWALSALTDDTYDVPGIGPETRRKVRAALGLDDARLLLHVLTQEAARDEWRAHVEAGNNPAWNVKPVNEEKTK